MLATAGMLAFSATQSMPAMIADVGPLPLQPSTRTPYTVAALAMP